MSDEACDEATVVSVVENVIWDISEWVCESECWPALGEVSDVTVVESLALAEAVNGVGWCLSEADCLASDEVPEAVCFVDG